ncbi:class F sortase [Streptomyces demainii]|uniref:Sortase (Surface protein transpeptidase) n=1 Tax=Streptomyces demainii TaxID=588122 RepID=A0ABT9KVG7_9ACTN|nr:class F sortase [Streptomyces demainii]MDP9612438.1 sortase (surface protein transpeptidase) [Streptomyces demainii]
MRRPLAHTHAPRGPLPRGNRLTLIAAGVAFCLGCGMVQAGTHAQAPPSPSAAEARPTRPAATTGPVAPPMPLSRPTRIRIPRIGVDAPVVGVDLDASGYLQAPRATKPNLAGWYVESPTPGSAGNSVIDGHVDTPRGPAVFYELGALHRRDPIHVTRADGTTAEFTVDAIEVYPKRAVPADRVYGPTRRPQLRVITCGGGYTPGSGYRGNVVVYAHLTRARGHATSGK